MLLYACMKKTYLFYDIESTGLSQCFDQVLQFAAIRTDLAFNEIEREEVFVKLNPDVIPSPYAFLTHQIPISDVLNGLPEIDAMKKIHAMMNQPGTISVGYNTLGFDDEFLRFSFYRNLLTPYTHQYANQCSRMDIFPMTVLYFLYKKSALQWPETDGKISLKLDNINQANHFVSGQAHNALVDVEATVALAKALAKEKDMWDYVCGYFNKQTEMQRSMKLPQTVENHREGLMIMSKLGAAKRFQAPVLCLGTHHVYKNQTCWLRLDLPKLRETDKKSPEKSTWVINKKWGEPGFALPLQEKYLAHMAHERLEEAEKNKKWLKQHPGVFHAICDYYLNYQYPLVANTDVDAALYVTDFWDKNDIAMCREFHEASSEEKAKQIHHFRNPHLKAMAIRLLGRHYPETLDVEANEEYQHYLEKVFSEHPPISFKGETKYSQQQCLADIANLRKEALSDHKSKLLDAFEQYISPKTNQPVRR
jgi:exodeoxyribonuclease I